jgi:hypothetical protein
MPDGDQVLHHSEMSRRTNSGSVLLRLVRLADPQMDEMQTGLAPLVKAIPQTV